jgi:hypothetical protein
MNLTPFVGSSAPTRLRSGPSIPRPRGPGRNAGSRSAQPCRPPRSCSAPRQRPCRLAPAPADRACAPRSAPAPASLPHRRQGPSCERSRCRRAGASARWPCPSAADAGVCQVRRARKPPRVWHRPRPARLARPLRGKWTVQERRRWGAQLQRSARQRQTRSA